MVKFCPTWQAPITLRLVSLSSPITNLPAPGIPLDRNNGLHTAGVDFGNAHSTTALLLLHYTIRATMIE